MNPVQLFEYGKKRGGAIQPNTFIGGVASTILTKEDLATKLGISSANISYFAVIGNDIEATISINYALPNYVFVDNEDITYFIDKGKITSIGQFAFSHNSSRFTGKLKYISIPNATIAYRHAFSYLNEIDAIELNSLTTFSDDRHFVNSGCNIYIPSIATIGNNTSNQAIFENTSDKKAVIYLPPSFATVNAGAEEPDIVHGRSFGATISYIQNYTTPSPINNLSVGTVYGTAVQLNFTPPTGSFNAIDYYELYVNGIYNKKITSGDYITGLSLDTNYIFEVKPVDIYYNKSTSNTVVQKTNATYTIPTSNIVSYYKMEGNTLDSAGTNHGTPTAITYTAGLAGQAAVFNGSSSFITIPDADNLSFTDGTNDKPFSFILPIKWTANQISLLFSKFNSSVREYTLLHVSGVLTLRMYSLNSSSILKEFNYSFNPITGEDYIFAITHDANGNLQLVINNVNVGVSTTTVGNYTRMSNTNAPLIIGKHPTAGGYFFNGILNELPIFNKCLSKPEISDITVKLLSGQSLI